MKQIKLNRNSAKRLAMYWTKVGAREYELALEDGGNKHYQKAKIAKTRASRLLNKTMNLDSE
ncbi:MAG TPA: hypothetical protein DCY20_05930 [Firmicutes bacterium]|nr:hypothetical protein [Bacillota bacterium]